MKILSVEQIRAADAATIEREPISSVALMERAADACFREIKTLIQHVPEPKIRVFCGMGNNGGDGLVIARRFKEEHADVEVYACRFSDNSSNDFQANEDRLSEVQLDLHDIRSEAEIPEISAGTVIIDALFGSGLSRPVTGFTADLIRAINDSHSLVISIDMPSGLFGEDNQNNPRKAVVEAAFTLTFQVPNLALLFPQNAPWVGRWQVLDIGLDSDFMTQVATSDIYLTSALLRPVLKDRSTFSHKGTYGHALLLAGSKGKMGAAVLAARACLKSGVGLLSAQVPEAGNDILQVAVPEAMTIPDETGNHLGNYQTRVAAHAWGIGPGIGIEEETGRLLKMLIQESGGPMVLDADALNLLAANPTWLSFLPERSILTPHPGEFARLAGPTDQEYGRYETLKAFSRRYGVYVVLKGAYTAIACPDGEVFFNSTGNPGMATAGSGDVLTGLLLGLLAQGYSPKETALLGVFLHGLAGDLAVGKTGQESLIASDIVDHIGPAIRALRG